MGKTEDEMMTKTKPHNTKADGRDGGAAGTANAAAASRLVGRASNGRWGNAKLA